jgi:hypothetical protein
VIGSRKISEKLVVIWFSNVWVVWFSKIVEEWKIVYWKILKLIQVGLSDSTK